MSQEIQPTSSREIANDDGSIVTITSWRAYYKQADEFIRRWQIYNGIIQTYPGALGAKLHRPINGSREFAEYAEWRSLADRIRAMELKNIEHPELNLSENSLKFVSKFEKILIVRKADIFF